MNLVPDTFQTHLTIFVNNKECTVMNGKNDHCIPCVLLPYKDIV